MEKKNKSSLKGIGYLEKLPSNANIDDYEEIKTKNKAGKMKTLYREIKNNNIDETTNFTKSWQVFNNHLS